MDDKSILEAIKANENRTVLRELYKTALPSISKFIRSNGGTKADCEDCFQESVLVLIAQTKKGNFNTDFSIRNYLFAIARNKWFKEVSRIKNLTDLNGRVEHFEEVPILVDKEKEHIINELFNSTGANCARLMRMVIYDNLKYKEISKILLMANEGVVKSSYYRCKEKLRNKIKDSKTFRALLTT